MSSRRSSRSGGPAPELPAASAAAASSASASTRAASDSAAATSSSARKPKRKFTATTTPAKRAASDEAAAASSPAAAAALSSPSTRSGSASKRGKPSPAATAATIDSDTEMKDAPASASPAAARTGRKGAQAAEAAAAAAAAEAAAAEAESDSEERKSAAGDDGEAEDANEEEGEKASDQLAAAASDSDSDPDADGADEYGRNAVDESGVSALYEPAQSAEAEVEDASDPFGSSLRRQQVILRQLAPQTRPAELPGLEAERMLLKELLSRTLYASQNNAALLLGPRGCGKSALLDSVLAELRADLAPSGQAFVVVRLSGLVQRDDTLAIREVVRQLCSDHELEPLSDRADFHTCLAFLLQVLDSASYDNLPIFFVLDHFHEFAARPKQTLLYNLCDLLQSGKAQMALVGLTPHLDCYERLEKRIRSRMSHRRILVGAQAQEADKALTDLSNAGSEDQASKPSAQALARAAQERKRRGMDSMVRMLRARLEIGVPPAAAATTAATAATAAASSEPVSKRKLALAPAADSSSSSSSSAAAAAVPVSPYVTAHNASIARLLSPEHSASLWGRLDLHVQSGRPAAYFLRAARLAVAHALSPNHPHITPRDLIWAMDYIDRDWTIEALTHCTTLELTLLVAYHLLGRRHLPHVNFVQMYAHYQSYHQRSAIAMGVVGGLGGGGGGGGGGGSVTFFPESVALKSFEALLSQSALFVWAEGSTPSNPNAGVGHDPLFTGRAIQRRFNFVKCRVSDQELTEALKQKRVKAPTWLVQWASKGGAD